ncbi:hypothetical protein [Flavobacterium pectinovorum]|uniref:CarboxypepD_reg-like domain-containing protein n=1 Tax=Flavobacterium pectinovorum TaxID=29533 RepID=A0A502E862_9FLAO|nr:hypothetical protein [Flavobacterium pectinovorum]TPG32631.1 hypothetical protein EAH81_25440 [Flavobacterium pectinovorum]
MKIKLLTTISFLTCQLSISQTGKVLHGKVIFQNNALKNVEVINKTGKTSTTTNDLGEFSIVVNVRDSLIFFSKDYFFKRLRVTKEYIAADNLEVNMSIKPEELDEVIITDLKMNPFKISQKDLDAVKVEKDAASLQKYTGVNDGSIAGGLDLGRMVTGLRNLFKKDKDGSKTKTPNNGFKKLVAKSIPNVFFTRDLKLNQEEKELFLDFCDADPKSITLLNHSNILATMEFLTLKNEEFKKLKNN